MRCPGCSSGEAARRHAESLLTPHAYLGTVIHWITSIDGIVLINVHSRSLLMPDLFCLRSGRRWLSRTDGAGAAGGQRRRARQPWIGHVRSKRGIRDIHECSNALP